MLFFCDWAIVERFLRSKLDISVIIPPNTNVPLQGGFMTGFLGEKKIKQEEGTRMRTIPDAINELNRLLNLNKGVEVIQPLIAELEGMYVSVEKSFSVAPQHEADAANAMMGIRRTLSDSRLEALGIQSQLAFPKEDKDSGEIGSDYS